MKLSVIGLGYIGLPTALLFASKGLDVMGIDVNKSVVEKLNNKELHIEENGLQELLVQTIDSKNFKAATEIEHSDYYIVAVPTPHLEDNSCDVSYLKDAVMKLKNVIKKGDTIIVESTIGPRTMEDIVQPMIESFGFTVGEDIYLAHCPERVLPGKIIHEMIHNNRIIGGITEACIQKTIELYKRLVQGKLLETKASTAEMSKLMENTYRDVNIALANELVKISDNLNINALDVIKLANEHPRVNIHLPGPGVGGHCLAVDPYFIVASDPENSEIIANARRINNSMPKYVIEKVNSIMDSIQGKKLTVLGLTYKGNIDDIRESPALDIYHELKLKSKYEVVAQDSHVQLDWVENDITKALENSDLALVLTDHNEYKELANYVNGTMKQNIVFDTKNIVGNTEEIKYYNFNNIYSTKEV
ncbi:nucleotide sugar dehydrogenase [Mammaliicoccus vitulinus]|uniref:nucleotide sugar dehydrogenase n=1 Tax=Mammaliicoccus vitulinus TaxID=71237 RepID=UPI000D1D1E5A|nr:nucleotide sugar dehydrogenase [Mammaliicoccus vitulinus]PTI84777.1 UDP-N-acetyl-D-mannosamine dehydrogenase [Mammaliicoccus vitulinus]QQT15407.1 nucleotide sugar dehydrogenase [Mammaliicoccus vitulinus]QQY19289.1 nucleotide sugar dehydrogenase [Mammaliicoccus vitulinus]RTX83964.1 nucleotide sugar dehydrogenase [Mammaliicoccus vitulinus]GGI03676.1 UDP-N-acetyl-D-mannosamine dehydrogenase [Mammaliicoccus vitulinus]